MNPDAEVRCGGTVQCHNVYVALDLTSRAGFAIEYKGM